MSGIHARPTILIIDDSALYRRALSLALTPAGFEVLEADDGEHGLKLAAQHRPAAMIVDGVLPGMDGPSVIRRVRLDPHIRSTPCLILTVDEDRSAEVHALESGADAFARKGQQMELIVARVKAMVRASMKPFERELTPIVEPTKLLIVDDDELWLDSMVEILREDGYQVSSARNGEAAIAHLEKSAVDGILLDMIMPGMGGLEACRRLKEVPALREIPLIVLTSMVDPRAMIEAFAAGADDFVLKTSDPGLLRARVRAQVRRKQFEDENRLHQRERAEREMQALATEAAQDLAHAREELLRDLQRKNKELEAFGYSISHDLRSPLRAIDGLTRILGEDYGENLDDKGREYVDRIRAATKRMGEQIDDLARLSRIGRAELRRESVDLAATARTVVQAIVERAGGDRIVEVEIQEPLLADADPRMLRLAFENLLNNAWKFTGRTPRARVELGSKIENGEVIYYLRDNGVGFDTAYAGKLFAPFQRLHSEADFPGTGVGLATVYRIIDRHGGRIWAESAPNAGATFYFTLPARNGR